VNDIALQFDVVALECVWMLEGNVRMRGATKGLLLAQVMGLPLLIK